MRSFLLLVGLVAGAACRPPAGVQRLWVVNESPTPLQLKVNRASVGEPFTGVRSFESLGLEQPVTLSVLSGSTLVATVKTAPLPQAQDLVWLPSKLGARRLVDYSFAYSTRKEVRLGGHSPSAITVVLGNDGDALVPVPRHAIVLQTDTPLPRSVLDDAAMNKPAVLRLEALADDGSEAKQAWLDRLAAEMPGP